MSRKGLSNLLGKYLAGECSPEEQKLIDDWFESLSLSGSRFEDIPAHEQDALVERLYKRILATNQKRPKLLFNHYAKVGIAAAILGLLGFTLYLLVPRAERANDVKMVSSPAKNSIQQVKLLVGNREIVLDSSSSSVSIDKQGKISYNKGAELSAAEQNATLVTPPGATYHLALSDGSSVILNAGSRITFPTHFTGTEPRIVSLDGQAYFEVAKQTFQKDSKRKVPFIVKTSHQDIEVLGTHFDVKSYAEDDQTITTLIEGKVKASYKGNEQLLHPGDEAVTINGHLEKKKANMEEALAWMDGKYVFDDVPLKEIFKTIGRWYDKDIYYQGVNANRRFGGSVSLKDGLGDVLEEICSIADIQYKVSGRRVVIMN